MRTRHLIACGLAALSLAAAGCSEEEAEESVSTPETAEPEGSAAEPAQSGTAEAKPKPKVTVPEGDPPTSLQVDDLEQGTGPAAKPGSRLSVNYVGVNYSNGEEFDSSFSTGAPFDFQLGAGMVIPGWNQGLEGMKVGGRRRLVIPP